MIYSERFLNIFNRFVFTGGRISHYCIGLATQWTHMRSWLVIMRMLSDIITISFSLNFKGSFTCIICTKAHYRTLKFCGKVRRSWNGKCVRYSTPANILSWSNATEHNSIIRMQRSREAEVRRQCANRGWTRCNYTKTLQLVGWIMPSTSATSLAAQMFSCVDTV